MRALLFVLTLFTLFVSASAPALDAEVDRINLAIRNRAAIAQRAWDAEETAKKFSIDLAEFEKSFRAQVRAVTDGEPPAGFIDQAYKNLTPQGLEEYRKKKIAALWPVSEYAPLTVAEVYDLSRKDLPEAYQKLVRYFSREYGIDVSSFRILVVDGLEAGFVAKRAATSLHKKTDTLRFTIQKGQFEFSGPITLNGFESVLAKFNQDVYGAKDVVFLSAPVAHKFLDVAMMFVAHEIRHGLDANANLASYRNADTEIEQLTAHVNSDRQRLIAEDRLALKDAPHFKKYMTALEAWLRSKAPAIRLERAELEKILASQSEQTLWSAAANLPNDLPWRASKHEQRGYWEQARYSRIELNWGKEKYLTWMTHDLRILLAPRTDSYIDFVELNGEKVFIDLTPSCFYSYNYHSEMFDRPGKPELN